MAPIDTMTTQQIRSLESNILTEHFRWSPETFAKQGMDLANLVMYEATKQVEDRLNEIAATKGDTSGFSEDDIQRVRPHCASHYADLLNETTTRVADV